MKGIKMYTQIKQLKEKGFKEAAVAKQLGIHRKTVRHYWNMTAEEFEKATFAFSKTKLLSEYETTIYDWMMKHPSMTAAQVSDWLKEHYHEDFKDRTVSRYVRDLRMKYAIKKSINPRNYEAVNELPMGQQLQVDFGEKWMESVEGGKVKVRFAAFVLSHSRYKYASYQSRPFTTIDLVRACRECFSYFGGIPQELVFDQDSIVSVSENYGDIIYTHEFEKFRQECKFSIYLCRAADPESKGKIERVVQYIKNNFLENRLFADDEVLNYCGTEWLERTGNAKVHGTTKKIPAEIFAEEREYLKLLPSIDDYGNSVILRTVRKDNTIVYGSNRYSLPLDTYNNQKEVRLEIKDGKLMLYTTFNDFICDHPISAGKGMLIKSTTHTRDTSSSIDSLQETVNILLNYEATEFLGIIRTEKSRYARDQFKLIQNLCDKYGIEKVLSGIEFCVNSRLYSATYAKEFLEYYEKPKQKIKLLTIPVSDNKYHITTEKRSLDVYVKAGGHVE